MSARSSLLVLIQFICLAYLFFYTGLIAEGWWIILQLLGIVISGWAVIIMRPGHFNIQPELKRNAEFITRGPYILIRNPMYAGLILYFGAVTADNYQKTNLIVYLILIIVLLLKIYSEEFHLKQRFGEPYLHYKRNSYRLIPFLF